MDAGVDVADISSLDDFVDAVGEHERAHARIALAAATLADSGLWAVDGWVSIGAWLQHHCKMTPTAARALVREGRFLRDHPAVAEAAVSGRISAAQLAAVRAAVTAPTAELFVEHQHAILAAIGGLDVADTTVVCQQWRQRAEAVVDMPEPSVAERAWTMSRLDDGTGIGRFVFDPATTAQLDQAITIATTNDDDDQRPTSTRQADAVASIIAFFNANHQRTGTPRHRPHLELHLHTSETGSHHSGAAHDIDLAGPVTTGGGPTSNGVALPRCDSDVFLCDCVIHRVLRAGGTVLDYGRSTRSVPANLFRAVAARDGGCRFPHCTRPVAWCDAHHIRWWRNHGHTTLDNLILLCSYHHHLIHREPWTIQLEPTGTTIFARSDGRILTGRPPGQPTIRAPIAA